MQDEVREAALRLLDYQDRSAGELRDRLKKKSYSAEDVEETVRALQECGLVDDRRYASVFAQSKIAAGKGRNYIVGKLREKKVSAEIVETVIEELMEEEDELLLCLKKALSVCGLSDRFEVSDEGEIQRRTDLFSETEESVSLEYCEPADGEIRSDRLTRRSHREKAKAKVTRRLISAGFSPELAFEAVRRIERL